MLLKDLKEQAEGARLVCGAQNMQNSENTEITSLCANSELCEKGGLFFCLTGGKIDSHIFALDAVEKGAAAIVCERELELSAPQIVVPNARVAMSRMARYFYGLPDEKLKIIAVTGTNGKTTTSYMLASVLKRAGKKVGIVGTLGIFYGKKKIAPELTTPDPIFLHGALADMIACGVEYVVMEVSAHALHHRKVEGIRFAAAIFTNFSRDHLDFFKSMKEYKAAKKRLFDEDKCEIAILNGDDPVGREIGKTRGKKDVLYYALETPSDAFAIITREEISGSECMLNLFDSLCRVSLSVPGKCNVYNALAAATCAYALGVRMECISGGLKALQGVEGRLERVESFGGAELFVDFAHTPDGLEKSLDALLPYAKNLYLVFGCGGDRDKEKRSSMGEIAAKKANFTVLTSDNPRYEDPVEILSEIEKGVRRFSTDYVVIPDRKEAIFYAVSRLKKGDVLLVAGKGGEDTQEIMGIKYSYNDKATIKEAIARISPLE